MIEYSVKTPTIPLPFHRLLNVFAIVDREDLQTKAVLDTIATEGLKSEYGTAAG